MSSEERMYSEREVEEIIRKATEHDRMKALAQSDGMSLAELKAIGAEAGIDPERIERAAHSLVRIPEARAHPLLGAPTAIDYEAEVPGEISPDRIPDAVALIRRITGKPGKLTELHGTVEWRADGDMGSRWVTVPPREGHSTIRASARLGQGAMISFIPSAVLSIFAIVATVADVSNTGNALPLLLLPLMLVSLYLIPRNLWSRSALKESENLKRAVEELGRLAESTDEDG